MATFNKSVIKDVLKDISPQLSIEERVDSAVIKAMESIVIPLFEEALEKAVKVKAVDDMSIDELMAELDSLEKEELEPNTEKAMDDFVPEKDEDEIKEEEKEKEDEDEEEDEKAQPTEKDEEVDDAVNESSDQGSYDKKDKDKGKCK